MRSLPSLASLCLATFVSAGIVLTTAPASASAPPLRDQVSLNGTWSFTPERHSKTTIQVPDAWDAAPGFKTSGPKAVTFATYERQVSVPSNWSDRVIKVEFEGINHIADVYVDDVLVANHVGGWTPFAVDVTGHATPGSSFLLRVEVKGGSHAPIVNNDGKPVWPVGWSGHIGRWGIVFDVWLRSYGRVHIEDAFIQTSVQDQTLTVDYTLTNRDVVPRTVTVEADVERGGIVALSLTGGSVQLAPGETRVVEVTKSWQDPLLWSPESPVLYHLESRLADGSSITDSETRRFGFREFRVEGNQFLLNGTRFNLWGDNMTLHSQGMTKDERYQYMSPETWPSTVEDLLDLNIRVLRPHQQPAPPFVLDVADEKGLLIIEESAIYSRLYFSTVDRQLLLQNCLKWIPAWVKARRNHPSIVMWSAENEMQLYGGHFSQAQLAALGQEIRKYDTSRPVIYDGDGAPNGESIINKHYPEGYDNGWAGSIYRLSGARNSSKPLGYGEYLTDYGPDGNLWWQGTLTRGLRYTDFTDLRPYKLFWAWDGDAEEALNLRNSFAPVALFDKAYDDLGINPLRHGAFPVVKEGAQLSRTLVLYNDELSVPTVKIEVEVSVDGIVFATGSQTGSLDLGEHIDIPYSFQVPYTGNSTMEVTLRTRKRGLETFEEVRRFQVSENGQGSSSSEVSLDWGAAPPPPPPPSLVFSDDFESGETSSWN